MPSQNSRQAGRPEFGAVRAIKETGRTPRKKRLRPHLADLGESRAPEAGHHGEDGNPELGQSPPREDRAG